MIVEVVRVMPSDRERMSRVFDEMGDRADRLEAHLQMVRPIKAEMLDDLGRRLFGYIMTADGVEGESIEADCDPFEEWGNGVEGSVTLRMTDANGLQAAVRATTEALQ
jgi:hypothetical protein